MEKPLQDEEIVQIRRLLAALETPVAPSPPPGEFAGITDADLDVCIVEANEKVAIRADKLDRAWARPCLDRPELNPSPWARAIRATARRLLAGRWPSKPPASEPAPSATHAGIGLALYRHESCGWETTMLAGDSDHVAIDCKMDRCEGKAIFVRWERDASGVYTAGAAFAALTTTPVAGSEGEANIHRCREMLTGSTADRIEFSQGHWYLKDRAGTGPEIKVCPWCSTSLPSQGA